MSPELTGADRVWLGSGEEMFPAMLEAIDAAGKSVEFETYIYAGGPLGERFRGAFVRAARRGVRVRVLVDGLGSHGLPSGFWQALHSAGGEARVFNPWSLGRLGIRDHRKLLVCDSTVAFIGGFNVAPEYEGDGVRTGWCDLGIRLRGPVAGQLGGTFEEMFGRSDFRHKRFQRLRRSSARRTLLAPDEQILLSGPGRNLNPIKRALRLDLSRAQNVAIVMGYFLPSWRLRQELEKVARRGGRVRLILAGKSDVTLSLLAAQSLYSRLLKAGVEIWEYQPQVLHAKLILIDGIVYLGSANLDQRSLNINYELMVRFANVRMAQEADEFFRRRLQHCRAVVLEEWRRGRTFWQRLKRRWAYFVLVRIDPYIARRQWRALPD